MSPELEKLIDLAVADGEVTEQEMNVLRRKVEETGADWDEFQMVLDAKLYNARKANQPVAPAAPVAPAPAPKANTKHGGTRKCPGCGTPVGAFQTQCSECGFEFNDVGAVQSANSLFEKLQNLEMQKAQELAQHEDRKQHRLIQLSEQQNSGGAMKTLFKSKEAMEKERVSIMESFERDGRKIEEKYLDAKITLIKSFAVPNTKEDLLELLSMASSNAYDNDGVVGKEEEAWIQKTDQVYQKLLIASANDKDTLNQATSLIVSLIKRLPDEYKNFTRIPKDLRDRINTELKAEKAERREEFWKAVKEACLGWRGWVTAAGIALFVIGIIIPSSLMSMLGLAAGIVGGFMLKKVITEAKNDPLYN